jgi:hypothetical protein
MGFVLFCACAIPAEGCRRAALDDRAPSPQPAAAASGFARAAHVCHLLQGGPAERRAACCGGRPSGHVESECVRELESSLAAGRIELDQGKIQRCSEASARALEGCDWVTPGQPLPPAECEGLTRGRVALGSVCRSSLECESPLHCEGSTPSQSGRCEPPHAVGAPCGASADALATYLFARDVDRTHSSCAGDCSLVTHRCESARAERPTASAFGKRAGEACSTDFDCRVGGCTGNPGTCGMKCAISFADTARFTSLPPLGLPRRSPR